MLLHLLLLLIYFLLYSCSRVGVGYCLLWRLKVSFVVLLRVFSRIWLRKSRVSWPVDDHPVEWSKLCRFCLLCKIVYGVRWGGAMKQVRPDSIRSLIYTICVWFHFSFAKAAGGGFCVNRIAILNSKCIGDRMRWSCQGKLDGWRSGQWSHDRPNWMPRVIELIFCADICVMRCFAKWPDSGERLSILRSSVVYLDKICTEWVAKG